MKRGYMTSLPSDYRDRVYAGWLGKCIGVRMGQPVESWTYKTIADNMGEISDFLPLPPGKIFKPDDDTAFPLVMIRALEDYGPGVTAEQMGETVLNYLADQRGTFWWGGYGVSTEHTGYLNLARGIPAPRSGSISLNGKTAAEQIGGQIFSDVWGLVAPDNPPLAAEYAGRASSVTHDGEGINGGRFVAGLVSAAFSVADPVALVGSGLSLIPADSEFARVTRAVLDFYRRNPDDWRACYHFIAQNFGYDRYPGVVHIIPNAGLVVMALLYSRGELARAVQIATMAGWDTDCNAGDVGAIMGVAVGLDGIDRHLRDQMNDVLIGASVIGGRNLTHVPACADLFCRLGEQVAGVEAERTPARYHFDYPGSTCGFQAQCQQGELVGLGHAAGQGLTGRGALRVAVRDQRKKGELRLFARTYHRPVELSGNFYGASFSPQVYPGQTVTARLFIPAETTAELLAAPFVWDDNHQTSHQAVGALLTPGEWHTLTYTIPRLENALISQVGVVVHPRSDIWSGSCLLDTLDISGPAWFSSNFSRERAEFGASSQWTFHRGFWRLEEGAYHGSGADISESYTGDVAWRDLTLVVDLRPISGDTHNVNVRVQGARRSYAVGLASGNRLVLYKNAGGYRPVAEADCPWEHGQRYRLEVEATGAEIAAAVNGRPLLRWLDRETPYLHGQVGLSVFGGCHAVYERVAVTCREDRSVALHRMERA